MDTRDHNEVWNRPCLQPVGQFDIEEHTRAEQMPLMPLGPMGTTVAGQEQIQPYIPPGAAVQPTPFAGTNFPIDQPTGVTVPSPPTTGDTPADITPAEEGAGAEGPVSDCGPRVGYVALAGEDFIRVQNYVDRGGNPWRLDPVETARVVGAAKLGFSKTDPFWLRGTYVDSGSGLFHALVWSRHKTCVFLLELYQPVKQGRGGIWAVERVVELESTTPAPIR
ncbi:hypothetical protein OS242_08440 [Tumebacillus sp. DT12]|uniref:Uncharacterized protein n=1 Tax=Tumebacillus lacus TaxID=2995335 RepID=A0ABT3X2I5_9BACL|nr:hypothetical protein [Tumebacillus lacus]MCX7569992.1 hypothetical protein [Tumebacillus lacus]